MSPARKIVIVLAAVAALGAWFVVRAMMARNAGPQTAAVTAAPAKPTTQVLTAKRDLPVGTRLASADMEWRAWPADALNPAFITDGAAPDADKKGGLEKAAKAAGQMLGGSAAMQALEGAVVRDPILAGEPILAGKIVRGGEGGYMAAVLRPGMRAVAVPISAASAAAGFILPGDRVDVMHSREEEMLGLRMPGAGARTHTVAEIVLANVRVLAVDQTASPKKDEQTLLGAVATLEVTPGGAEALMQARSQGELVLALRSAADGGARSGPPRPAEDAAPGVVRIHRGGQVSAQAVRP
jgi:pilus assembly protein CpaB